MKLSRKQFIGLLGGLGLSSCTTFDPAHISAKGPLTFVAISDLHVLDSTSTEIVDRAVAQINADNEVDFTIVLGDLATDGRPKELNLVADSLAKLDQPFFCVPGNHDVEGNAPPSYASYTHAIGDPQWTHDDKGWLFIGLDTCNGTASDVTVPPERLLWLETQLEGLSPKRPIALFTHHPFNPNTKAYRVKNADQTLALFKGLNLRLVASGHYHGNQIETHSNILFTTSACCSSTRSNFDGTTAKGYRRFQVTEKVLNHTFVKVST